MEKKLYRNENDKMVAGVASGLAEHLNIDATLIRLGFVIAVFAAFGGVLIYIILWIVIPPKPYANISADYNIYDEKTRPLTAETEYSARKQGNGRFIAGMVLVIMGVLFLFKEFHLLPYWFSLHRLWPLALIIPGIMILTKSRKADEYGEREETWNKKQEVETTETNNDSTTTTDTSADSKKPID